MAQSYKVHTSIAGAAAILAVGEVLVSEKWKQTDKQSKKELAILLPMECVKAPEVPEAFRAVVESALMATAERLLKQHGSENPNNYEVLASTFERPNLAESFVAHLAAAMTPEELKAAWLNSATWKGIVANKRFATDKVYQATAAFYRDAVCKLANRNVSVAEKYIDPFIAKLAEEDLETEVGQFIIRRLNALRPSDGIDLSVF